MTKFKRVLRRILLVYKNNFSGLAKRKSGLRLRYRVKDRKRFIAFALVFTLCIVAVILAVQDSFHPVQAVINVIAPTPTLTPVPTPTPTPTPTPVPTLTPTPVPPGKTVKDVVITIDPGHGGRDPGTISPDDDEFFEKDVVLDTGLRLGSILENEGIRVVYTRKTDIHLDTNVSEDIHKRCYIANDKGSTLFVSIHVNAYTRDPKGRPEYNEMNGTEFYYYGNNTYYNGMSGKGFAEIMRAEMMKSVDTKDNGLVYNNLGVLRLTNMPAVLVELAYISNKDDQATLRSSEFRQNAAEGMALGILRTLNEIGAVKEGGKWIILADK